MKHCTTNRVTSVLALAALLLTAAAVATSATPSDNKAAPNSRTVARDTTAPPALPRLLDLGADKCIPCKMMMPILDELEHELVGQLQVEFIDVWKHPEKADPYGIKMIPTQIFFDAHGKELFRHTGFFPKDKILAKWRELGYTFHPAAKDAAAGKTR